MMADPSAASGEETTTTTQDTTPHNIWTYICVFFAAIGSIALLLLVSSLMREPVSRCPGISVTVGDIVGGLDPELSNSPVIHSALDLTFRVDNPREDTEVCLKNATVTVSSYGYVVLGLGHLFQQLCVEKGASAEVKAALSGVHVMLPDRLRGLMASKLRAGELKLLVELRMLVPSPKRFCHSCTRDIVLHYCRVSPGRGFSPCNCHALEIAHNF